MVLLKDRRVVAAVMVNQGKERKALEALVVISASSIWRCWVTFAYP